VHWCRHRVRFNEVPEKVPKVPGKVWDLVQRQGRFNRVPEIQRRFQEARVQSQVRSGEGQVTFNSIRRRSGRLWCIARLGSTGFRRMFR
jgi:tRNA(Ile2) C34 agmatinyltransferase TiaS